MGRLRGDVPVGAGAGELAGLVEAIREAKAAVDAFEAAWGMLSPEEALLLETVHRKGLPRQDAFAEAAGRLCCSESTARRRHKRALGRFRTLLLG